MTTDRMRLIKAVQPLPGYRLDLTWSDGTRAVVDLSADVRKPPFESLSDPEVFEAVTLDRWSHALEWPDGTEIGADSLWRDTLSATGRDDARQFLEWRLRNALSLSRAAEALGLSRRQVAYYSNGEKSVPKHILLALKGWEALQAA